MNRKFVVVAMAVVLLSAGFAQADLVVEVRAVPANIAGVTSSDVTIADAGKTVTVGGPASVVAFNVYAKVTDSLLPDDPDKTTSITELRGSLLATSDATNWKVRGNIELPLLVAPFTKSGSSGRGIQTDLNSDGDMDVGQNINTTLVGWLHPQAANLAPVVEFNAETLVASFVYNVTRVNINGTNDTLLNFRIQANVTGGAWMEDGIHKLPYPYTAPTNYSAGAPIYLGIPEPSTLVLLSMASFVLLLIRRRK
jgi:hypothetical protein